MRAATAAAADPVVPLHAATSAPINHRTVVLTGRLLLLLALLAAWEGCVRLQWADAFLISTPSAIIGRLMTLLLSGRLLTDVTTTLTETFLGLLIGAVLGIAAGAAMTVGRIIPDILEPFITALYGLPRIALAPLFIVWFGIGIWSKVAVTGSMVFFLTLLSTYMGMRQTDTTLLLAVKALGATKRQLLMKVRVPYAVPWIITALKTGVGMALIGTIVGEFIASSEGVGWYISYAGGQFDATGVMAGIVVLTLISAALNVLVRLIETRLMLWKPDVSI